jgi:timeless protein
VVELHQQLLRQESLPWLDKSHFLWLITYFLRFVSKLKLDIKHFKDIFMVDILCYLIWEGVQLTEEFETALNQQPPVDLKPGQRRLHLSVTAILEYLKALETYTGDDSFNSDSGSSRDSNEHENIYKLRSCLPAIHDLRQLFLLRLRHLKPSIQGRRYLSDVIRTNHVLLLMLEQIACQSYYGASFDLGQHLKQFCSRTILDQYGTALEDFKTNGSFVNDSFMTVLHHVGVDLDRADLLFEPIILRPFAKIWEEEFEVYFHIFCFFIFHLIDFKIFLCFFLSYATLGKT